MLLARATAALARGELVVYPTETVYGIGADAGSTSAVRALIRLKGRSLAKGVSLLVSNVDMADSLLLAPMPPAARRLAAAFWPGPLTLVLATPSRVANELRGVGGTLGLRCSSDPIAACLVRSFGRPLTSTSANPSGQPPARSVSRARRYFGDRVRCYLDGGVRDRPTGSTVVEIRGEQALLRRAGPIRAAALRELVKLEGAVG